MGKKTPPKYLASALRDIGKKFGLLTVVEITDRRSKDRKIIVKCACDCGNETHIRLSTLRVGNQISCGCATKISSKENGRKAVSIMIERGIWERDPKIGSAKRTYKQHDYNDGDLSFEDFFTLSQQNCFYCGREPSNCCNVYMYASRYSKERIKDGYFIYNGIDRVDNGRPHDKDNVVPCCLPCNKAKLTRTQQEFFDWIRAVYNLHCKD